jgi:halocyanin-like protein
MTGDNTELSRRGFLRATAGATAATAATGAATAAEEDGGDGGDGGGGAPAFGDWFSDVGNYDGEVVDARGQDEVTVSVGAEGNGGNYAFDPPAIHVDTGTTVIWEWTGQGQQHNVVAETGGDYESELTGEAGFTFEHTFEESGISRYYCVPHRGLGMKAAVVVGDDYATAGGGGGGDGGGGEATQPLPSSAMTLGVATTVIMLSTLGLAYFFMKYGGDYGDFEN